MTRPRILLVEDDPTTRAFLVAATEALPAEVDTAASFTAAVAAAKARDHDLWLLDARLPDGDGASLLAELRGRGLHAPALAHTAARERAILDALVAAGFLEALVKPISTEHLHAALRRALGAGAAGVEESGAAVHATGDVPLWDDAAALAALHGQQAHVDALRRLFLDELPGARDAVGAAIRASDPAALQAALHKLSASCGFVGAARLAAVVAELQLSPDPASGLDAFLSVAQDTLSSA